MMPLCAQGTEKLRLVVQPSLAWTIPELLKIVWKHIYQILVYFYMEKCMAGVYEKVLFSGLYCTHDLH